MRNYEVIFEIVNYLCTWKLFRIICICFISDLLFVKSTSLADAECVVYA